jgi:hypothetical protein
MTSYIAKHHCLCGQHIDIDIKADLTKDEETMLSLLYRKWAIAHKDCVKTETFNVSLDDIAAMGKDWIHKVSMDDNVEK